MVRSDQSVGDFCAPPWSRSDRGWSGRRDGTGCPVPIQVFRFAKSVVSPVADDAHAERCVGLPRAQVVGRESVFKSQIQPGKRRVHIIGGEVVVSSAADDEEGVGPKVSSDSLQDASPVLRGHEVQDVPDDKRAVEHRGLAEGNEIQPDEIRNDPGRSRVLGACGCDKHGIDVDPDDLVTELGEVPAMSSWAAPSVEKSCSTWRKSID